MIYKLHISIFLLIIFLGFQSQGQDIDKIIESKPFEFGGGSINLSSVYYNSFNVPSNRPGLSYYASGNLNFKIFGSAAPLSFSYTNRKVSYTQPFNKLSFAPQYKWIATRFGSQNQTYSPYTLNGHNFNGASVELTPGPITVKLAYGRFQKAIEPDTLLGSTAATTFKRMGLAASVGYQRDANQINVSFFTGKDDQNSVDKENVPEDTKPMQNMAFSIGGVKKITNRINLTADVGASVLHRDISSTRQKTISRQQFYAYKTNINYNGEGYTLSLGYEHVDPNYTSLGGYYFTNDLQKIVLGGATVLADGKINLNAQLGRERNNLQNSETSTTKNWVGAFNGSFQVNERLMLALNYSNFTAFTNIRPAVTNDYRDEIDTLNFYQISQNAAGSMNWTLGSKRRPKMLSVNASLQTTGLKGYGEENNPGTTYMTNTISYGIVIPEKSMYISTSVNAYWQEFGTGTTKAVGPAVAVGKSFFEKQLKSTWSASYNINQQESTDPSKTYSLRWNLSFQSKHKRVLDQQKRQVEREKIKREYELKKKDKGYKKERSQGTGLYLPEAISLRKQSTKKVKKQVEKKEKVVHTKKHITERHRLNFSVVFSRREVSTAEYPRFSEFTMRINYAYSF